MEHIKILHLLSHWGKWTKLLVSGDDHPWHSGCSEPLPRAGVISSQVHLGTPFGEP